MTRIGRWSTWAFFGLVVAILATVFDCLPWEQSLAASLKNLPPNELWSFFNIIVSTEWLLAVIVAVVTLVLYVIFLPRESIIPLAGIMGGFLIVWMLTPAVGRAHPALGSFEHAFPAAGATIWAAWIGSVILVISRRLRKGISQTIVIALLILLIVLGGFAQLTTGAYVLTDVLGGWLWSVAWILWLHQTTRSVV